MLLFIGLVLLPIISTILGEFLIKWGVNQLADQTLSQLVPLFLTSPWVIAGVLLLVGGGLVWLVAMATYELSFLYPFLTINYIAIIGGSAIFLGEQITLFRVLSVVFIVIGLVIISKSDHAQKKSV